DVSRRALLATRKDVVVQLARRRAEGYARGVGLPHVEVCARSVVEEEAVGAPRVFVFAQSDKEADGLIDGVEAARVRVCVRVPHHELLRVARDGRARLLAEAVVGLPLDALLRALDRARARVKRRWARRVVFD